MTGAGDRRLAALRAIADGGTVHHNTSRALHARGLLDAPVPPYHLTLTGRMLAGAQELEGQPMLAGAVADAIRAHRFRYSTEDDLQWAIAEVLKATFRGMVRREVRLDARSRVDVLVGRVAVEVKISGDVASLARQVARYAKHPGIGGVVVVTNRVRHARIPATLSGKPVEIVSLAGQL